MAPKRPTTRVPDPEADDDADAVRRALGLPPEGAAPAAARLAAALELACAAQSELSEEEIGDQPAALVVAFNLLVRPVATKTRLAAELEVFVRQSIPLDGSASSWGHGEWHARAVAAVACMRGLGAVRLVGAPPGTLRDLVTATSRALGHAIAFAPKRDDAMVRALVRAIVRPWSKNAAKQVGEHIE